jgi:hypothetical protein
MMIIFRELTMILKDPSALNDPENDCNECNYQKYVDETSRMECEKSYCPSDDQDNCNDIKQISHVLKF